MSLEFGQLGIELQERDLTLLRELFESRIMTLSHITTLFFEGRSEAAKKRVHKLKETGFVRERPRRPSEPSILFLTRQAFQLLIGSGRLHDLPHMSVAHFEKRAQVSELTIRHELQVMDVKAAFLKALASSKSFIEREFSTWPSLHKFEASLQNSWTGSNTAVVVKPDGFIRIQDLGEEGVRDHVFFLEVDRSTETLETLILRAACYGSYYRGGDFAVRCGGTRSDYRAFPFRVLMVFKSAERRNNAAERMLLNKPPILTHVWLTTYSEAISNPLEAIWIRPADFKNATSKTQFDVNVRQIKKAYQRHPDREELIDLSILKHSLFDSDPRAAPSSRG